MSLFNFWKCDILFFSFQIRLFNICLWKLANSILFGLFWNHISHNNRFCHLISKFFIYASWWFMNTHCHFLDHFFKLKSFCLIIHIEIIQKSCFIFLVHALNCSSCNGLHLFWSQCILPWILIWKRICIILSLSLHVLKFLF